MKKLLVLCFLTIGSSYGLYTSVASKIGAALELIKLKPLKKKLASDYNLDENDKAVQLLYDILSTRNRSEYAQAQFHAYVLQSYLEKNRHDSAVKQISFFAEKHGQAYLSCSQAEREQCWYDSSLQTKVLPIILNNDEHYLLGLAGELISPLAKMSVADRTRLQMPLFVQDDRSKLTVVHNPERIEHIRAWADSSLSYLSDRLFIELDNSHNLIVHDLNSEQGVFLKRDSMIKLEKTAEPYQESIRNVHSYRIHGPTRRLTYLKTNGKQYLCTVTANKQERFKHIWQAPLEDVRAIALSSSGRYCASITDISLRLFDCTTNKECDHMLSSEIATVLGCAKSLALNDTGNQIACAQGSALYTVDLQQMSMQKHDLPENINSVEYISPDGLLLLHFDANQTIHDYFCSGVYSPSHALFVRLNRKPWSYSSENGLILQTIYESLSGYSIQQVSVAHLTRFIDAVAQLSYDQLVLLLMMKNNKEYQISQAYERQLYDAIDPWIRVLVESSRKTDAPTKKVDLATQLDKYTKKLPHVQRENGQLDPSLIATIHSLLKIDYLSLIEKELSSIEASTTADRVTLGVGNLFGSSCWWHVNHTKPVVHFSRGTMSWAFARLLAPQLMIGLQEGRLFLRKAHKNHWLFFDPRTSKTYKYIAARELSKKKGWCIEQQELAQQVASVSVSDNGTVVACCTTRDTEPQLHLMRLTQKDEKSLNGQNLRSIEPIVVPDVVGTILHAALAGDGTRAALCLKDHGGVCQLLLCTLTEQQLTVLSGIPLGIVKAVDGLVVDRHIKHIAILEGTTITVCDTNGKEVACLHDPIAAKIQLDSFSPCGRFLLYTLTDTHAAPHARIMHVATGISFECNTQGHPFCFDTLSYDDMLIRSEITGSTRSDNDIIFEETEKKSGIKTVTGAASWDDCEKLALVLKNLSVDDFALLAKLMNSYSSALDEIDYARYQQLDPFLKNRIRCIVSRKQPEIATKNDDQQHVAD